MKNIRFQYLYRDGSNYKKWAAVVFSNDDGLPADEITEALRTAFSGKELFIATQIRVPEVFLARKFSLSPDDHCFHEFSSVEATDDLPDDRHARSIDQFITEVAREANLGWRTFDPQDPFLRNACS
jgi:hypothetical protein